MECFNTVFSELETRARAGLAGTGEDWCTLGYLTKKSGKRGRGLAV